MVTCAKCNKNKVIKFTLLTSKSGVEGAVVGFKKNTFLNPTQAIENQRY